jgi:putative sigma-54 modulation protein
MRITIKGTNLDLTDGVKRYIYDKIGGLEKFKENIDSSSIVRMEVGLVTRHHKAGKIYRAEANLSLPGNLLRAEAETEDLYKSIDEVKARLERDIDRYKKGNITKRHRAALVWKKLKSISPLAWLKNEFRKGKREKEKF